MKQLVEKVLLSTVDGYFRRVSAERTILDFITKYNDLTGEVRQALAPIGIAATTNLEEFECDDPEINERRKQVSLQEQAVATSAPGDASNLHRLTMLRRANDRQPL
ncbi:hypothetical protein [Amycolatopsis sp. CA-128772]|uniref:hypothetical protein n=1 Tax=Amycolatopsis sp. CA-128772 TaxID=2073159 RepID=UPI0011B074C6|nr:hypothetical protein [Amycolatopsis sp. CA-128772]